jgi:hypothetical protein
MQQIYFVPKYIYSFITFISLGLLTGLTGCTTTNLQNLAVEGPIFQPPVHMAKDSMSAVQLHPWVTMVTPDSRTGRLVGHTNVNSHGVYQVDTIKTTTPYTYQETSGANQYGFFGVNFSWQLPRTQYGLDMDVSISQTASLSIGGSYAPLDGEPYWQAYGMLSAKGHGVRFDVGIEWQDITYTADFVHKDNNWFSSNNNVIFFQIHNQETQINPFVALTLNGTSETSFINLFLQAAVVRQTFFYISDVSAASSFLNDCHETHYLYSLAPGMNIRFAENVSVLVGIRFIWDVSMESKATTTFQPLLQFDIGL